MAELCLPFTHARSERVVLRKAVPHDPEVRRFLGGPVSGEHLRARIALRGIASMTAEPGAFIVASPSSGELLGTVMLERRPAHRPGYVRATADELELSYLLRRRWWGQGHHLGVQRRPVARRGADAPARRHPTRRRQQGLPGSLFATFAIFAVWFVVSEVGDLLLRRLALGSEVAEKLISNLSSLVVLALGCWLIVGSGGRLIFAEEVAWSPRRGCVFTPSRF